MSRRKTLKDYAIKLVHPDLGDFYYQYNTVNSYYSTSANYYFTQNLNKVATWKTLKFVEKEIIEIHDKLKNKSARILLSLGKDPKEELTPKLVVSRKRYYYPITTITSKVHFDKAKQNIEKLNESLIVDSEIITNMIKNNKHLEKNFMSIVDKLEKDLNTYRKDFNYLEKNKNCEDIALDVVDASYGFRLLKLRTLKTIQNEEDEV